MNKKILLIPIAAITAAVLLTFTGCVPIYYDKTFRNNITTSGKKLLTEYLDANYSAYTIGEITMVEGVPTDSTFLATYGSTIASADVTIGDATYTFYADTDTGKIYSTENTKIVYDYLSDDFKSCIPNSSYELFYYYDDANFGDKIISHSNSRTNSYEVLTCTHGAFEVGMTSDEILSNFLDNADTQKLSIKIFYTSENQNEFSPVAVKDYLLEHPNISSFMIYNVIEPSLDIIAENNGNTVVCWAEENEFYNFYYKDDVINCTQLIYSKLDCEPAIINYVSCELTYGGSDFSQTSCQNYDCAAYFDGDTLTVWKPECRYLSSIYFTDNHGYSSALITMPDSSFDEPFEYKMIEVADGYYTLELASIADSASSFVYSNRCVIELK